MCENMVRKFGQKGLWEIGMRKEINQKGVSPRSPSEARFATLLGLCCF